MFQFRPILFIFFCLLLSSRLYGQGCPSTDINFYTQAAVDSFPVKYPDCHEIAGNLYITNGGGIGNLDSLYGLEVIHGSLLIRNNDLLKNLNGFSNLRILGDLLIYNNDSLLSISGFDKISILDTLIIKDNIRLEDLTGLNALRMANYIYLEDVVDIIGLDSLHRVNGDFSIYNSMIKEYKAAPLLDTVLGTLRISSLDSLHSLKGFEALRYAGDLMIIKTGVTDFTGMDGLAEVNSIFGVSGNNDLLSLNGLTSLARIGGSIGISNNEKLKDLNRLHFVKEIFGDLVIYGNDSLMQVDSFEQLKYVEGNMALSDNGLKQCDGFHSLRKIGGYLNLVDNDSLTDISGFNQLDSVGGELRLDRIAIDTLDGLNHLRYIGGRLFLFTNNSLQSITGFDSLESVGGIRLELNRFLTFFDSLSLLKQIKGNVEFSGNHRLKHLPSLPGISTIEGDLLIDNGADLSDLSGLDSLRSLTGRLELRSSQLDSLHGLEQLESCLGGLTLYSIWTPNLDELIHLKFIQGPLSIQSAHYLRDIQGLRNLNPASIYSLSTTPDIIIQNNTYLNDCSIEILCNILEAHEKEVLIHNNDPGCQNALDIRTHCGFDYACLPDGITLSRQTQIDSFRIMYPECTFMQGDVLIQESTPGDIVSIDSLYSVKSVGGSLHVSTNTNLTNLDGFFGLTTIGGGIKINFNQQLFNINGLSNVDPITLSNTRPQSYELWLQANPLLSTCAIASICGLLADPEAGIVVQGNGPKCSDPDTIRNECLVSVSDFPVVPLLYLYPNPANDELRIGTYANGNKWFEYMIIYNSIGEKVLQGIFESEISLKNLESGMYTMICYTNGLQAAVGRFVVMR